MCKFSAHFTVELVNTKSHISTRRFNEISNFDPRKSIKKYITLCVHPLHSEEPVRVLFFPKSVAENRKVVMVVQLVNVHLPADPVPGTAVVNLVRETFLSRYKPGRWGAAGDGGEAGAEFNGTVFSTT